VLDPEDVISTCFDVTNTTVSIDTFDINHLGSQLVTVTSLDQGGATHTCDFNVTVLDTISPVINSKSFTVKLNSSNTGSIADSSIRKLMYDNVGIETVSLSKSSFDCNSTGVNLVDVTATDASGNTTTVQITVDVFPDGFNYDSQDEIAELCVGENESICSPAGSTTNQLNYQCR
jgi:hypothetical protein